MALETLKFAIQEEAAPKTRIRVFGVGGGGCNAVARMLDEGLSGVEFAVLNTDVQALSASPVPNQLAMGAKITNGLGAGSDPAVAARRRSKTPRKSSICWKARTWCSSLRAWAAEPERARRR